MKKEKYPEGYFVNRWVGIGIAVFSGVWITWALLQGRQDLIIFGPAFGILAGLIVGSSIEQKYKREGRIEKKKFK